MSYWEAMSMEDDEDEDIIDASDNSDDPNERPVGSINN